MASIPSLDPPGGPPSNPSGPSVSSLRRSALGVSLGVAGLLLGVAAWSHSSTSSTGGDFELRPTERVDHVELSVASGSIEIVTGDAVLIETTRPERSRSHVSVEQELTGGRLTVRVSCSRLALRWRCATPLRLVVPAGTPVTAATRAGTITASGLTGGVDLRTSAGMIEVRDLEGRVRLRSEAGSLRGTLRRGSMDASTSAGAIAITVMDDLSHLSASTEVGPIDLVVPRAVYSIEAHTTLGRTDVALGSTAGASRTIQVRSEIGRVTIRPGPGLA